ncbi:beta-propeller fold lactonase family protein [Rossellomorea aquimaris]|uniref:beta-propeller fold lactonase family protein n=1 Tax=Rossellomorea aquimaris TaxID=189382 RepID=UPI001CD1E013|nr:beta-propeller fold lactonase family protein [Rossellomorea aquimaris]MCA1060685.1 beta-propeller fold lactonase family protein [Rossellomorea aquimaris]
MKKIIGYAAAFLIAGTLVACSIQTTTKDDPSFDTIRKEAVNSDNILQNKEGTELYIANLDANTVSIVDEKTQEVQKEIPVGKEPVQLALSPDEDRLYVSCRYDNKIDVISLEEGKVVDSYKVGSEPFGLMTSQNGKTLYVANYRENTIMMVDVKSGDVTETISVHDRPRTLALTANGKKLYVPHYLSGEISVLNTETNKVTKTIELADSPDVQDPKKSQGIPNTLEQFVISPDGKTAWIPHLVTNVDTAIQFEETIFPAISIIDLEKDEEIVDQRKQLFEEINVLDSKNETMIVSNPYDVTFQEDGSKAYAIMSGSEDLVVFDLKRGGNATQILRRIEGDNPRGVLLSKDGETLYVHNAMSHDLATIDSGGASVHSRAKKLNDNISLIKKDPLDPQVRKGKTIFYSANSDEFEADITGNNWMSCASCHSDGEINGLTLMTGKGQRNVPTNTQTSENGLFLWDGSRDDFTDYLLTVQGEMGGMMKYEPGEELPAEVEKMYDDLFAFLKEPTSFPVPQSPYKENGELTSSAKDGKALFEGKASCISCHSGNQFTDSVKATGENGKLTTDMTDYLHDIGTANQFDVPSEGDARAAFSNPRDGKSFDTPSLVGVWATGPYLHDGSAKTIEESIERHQYDEKSELSQIEMAKIADYVRSLD